MKEAFCYAKRLSTLFALAFLLTLPSQLLLADEVRLKNGDIITGKIIKKETNTVVLKTSYAGDININWPDILSIKSDDNLMVMLNDDAIYDGKLELSEPGQAKIKLSHVDATALIDLEELHYINPSPVYSGIGVLWSGRANLGGAINQGNTETSLLRFDAETTARTKDNRFRTGGVMNRARNQGQDTEYNSRANVQYDRFFSKKWYGYVNGTLENDRFRDLRLRTTVGSGAGYQVIETDALNLSLEGGLNYINVNYFDAEDESFPTGRWALKYNQKLFGGNTRVFHDHEILFGLANLDDTLVFSKTGLRFPLYDRLNASTQLNIDYAKTPAPGRVATDRALIFSLGYDW